MASGSRKLGPPGRFFPIAAMLLTQPENLGTRGRLRVICLISTSRRLNPWYCFLRNVSSPKRCRSLFRFSLVLTFPWKSIDRKIAIPISELVISGRIKNNSISWRESSSQRSFNHKKRTTLARDPCEYTSSRQSVPVSRLVEAETLKVWNFPENLGKPGLAVVIRNKFEMCLRLGHFLYPGVPVSSFRREIFCLTWWAF